jgi:hypothetical protein
MHRYFTTAAVSAALSFSVPVLLAPTAASAHGFAGDRFFPATILTDDPFVADEASLPTLTKNPRAPDGTSEYDLDVDIAKRLTPDLGLTFGDTYKWVKTPGTSTISGFDSIETGIQYQLFINPEHEFMGLLGFGQTWGNTGRVNGLGTDSFTTLSPTIDFGKGFGDLPDSMTWAKPLAITTNFSVDVPTRAHNSDGSFNPDVINYGAAFEYSLEYLQHHVRDVGLTAPFDRMIPLVEVAMSTPTGSNNGPTTGTIQPGVIWAGQNFQIGAEMIIPINSQSGHGIGGLVQFHFFLDDIFAGTAMGKPLLSDQPLFGNGKR